MSGEGELVENEGYEVEYQGEDVDAEEVEAE